MRDAQEWYSFGHRALALAVELALVVALASCAAADGRSSSGVEISYFASTLDGRIPEGLDYVLTCAASQSALSDPDAPIRAYSEGQLEPLTRVISGEPVEVWGASVPLPAGECGIWIVETKSRPDCVGWWPFAIERNAWLDLALAPLCGDRLCPPRGDVTLDVRTPSHASTFDLGGELTYTINCEGSRQFSDSRCIETQTLEGSVDMLGGLHLPVTGPFQDGHWRVTRSELPSGECTLEARAEAPYNEQASCFVAQAFTVPEENMAELDIMLECGAR